MAGYDLYGVPTTAREIARALGIPEATVKMWYTEKRLRQKLTLLEAAQAIVKILREDLAKARRSSEAAEPLVEAKVLLAREQTEKLRLENAKTTGELVPVSEVRGEWIKLLVAARSRFLALPKKLAYELSMISDPNKIELKLTEAVHEGLNALSQEDETETLEEATPNEDG